MASKKVKRTIPRCGIGLGETKAAHPFRLRLNDAVFLVCCDCSLRHILRVTRAPGRRDEVVLEFYRDSLGTEALRRTEGVVVYKRRRRKGK